MNGDGPVPSGSGSASSSAPGTSSNPQAPTPRASAALPSSSASANSNASQNPRPVIINPGAAAGGGGKGKGPAVVVGGRAGGGPVVVPNSNVGPGGVVRRPTLNSIIVNKCQNGNPVLQYLRNVAWEIGDIVPDYQVGATTGLLYLQLKYHLLHPEYIHGRIEKLGQAYSLRLMLVHCDVDNHAASIRELTKVCLVNNFTMLVAWSAEECARYLEIYKAFERKPPDLIKERVDDDYMSRLTSVLTSVKGVNKTDVVTLASSCGSFADIAATNQASLLALPGVGDKKAKRLRDALTGSFIVGGSRKKKKGLAQAIGEMGGQQLN